jgi:hypothetical protein
MDPRVLKRWLILGGLLGLTLFLVWNSPKKDADVVLPTRAATSARPESVGTVIASAQFKLEARLEAADQVTDLFAPVELKKDKIAHSPAVPVIPVAPPLPFTFTGKMIENGHVKVFLQEGETLYTVSEGEMLGSRYKVLGLENGKISLLYLPLNVTQTINVGNRLE